MKISILKTFIIILILIILFIILIKKYIDTFSAIKLILFGIEITVIASALIASHVENYIFGVSYAIQWTMIIMGFILCFIGLLKK